MAGSNRLELCLDQEAERRTTGRGDAMRRRRGKKENKERAALLPSWQLAVGSKISVSQCLNNLYPS
jgi:hypothetical protein